MSTAVRQQTRSKHVRPGICDLARLRLGFVERRHVGWNREGEVTSKLDGPRGSLSLAGDAHLRLTSAPRNDVDVHLPELAYQLVDRIDVDRP